MVEEMRIEALDRRRFVIPYMGLIIALGAMAVGLSAFHLSLPTFDMRFLLLVAITLGLGSRLSIQIPRLSSHISVSDTLIFLTMLLYGGETAILLAAAEALCASLAFSRKPVTIMFNSAVMACTTFLTVSTMRLGFGSIVGLPHESFSANFISALCVMALVQYLS